MYKFGPITLDAHCVDRVERGDVLDLVKFNVDIRILPGVL